MLRNVCLIAKKELSTYFQSWLGYVILFLALLSLGVLYEIYPLSTKSNTELMSAELLFRFFYFFSGVSMAACWFVTVKLFAEEQQLGTITLLTASPLKESEIVLGKYLSAVIFILILCLLSLYIPLDIYISGKVSFAHLFSGYVGIMLWSMVCISIGLFFSAVTKYQIIAFALTFLTSLLLVFTPLIGHSMSGAMKDIFVYAGIYATHFSNFAKGQIHLKDVFYFLSLSIFILVVITKLIEARRWK